jgi:hypothetical protein
MAAEDPRFALHLKNHHGLLRDVEFVRQLASEPGPRDRAAADVAEAVDAAVEVSERVSGARQLFVFFAGENPDDRRLQQLAASLRTEAVSIHGFVLEGSEGVGALRDVCEATPNGSLRVVSTAANLCDCVASAYLNLMTRYEITYPAPDNAEPRLCTLLVCSPHGCGRETIDFRRLAQPAKAD